MKLNRIYTGIVSLSMLLGGVVMAADSNITIKETQTNRTFNRDVMFFNQYVKSTGAAPHYSGSSTTNGGTSTFSNGTVYTGDLINQKDIALLLTPGESGGSCTVNIWGVFGTTAVGAGTTSAGVVLLNTTSYSGIGTATSSIVTITQKPELMAVGVLVSSGTVTVSAGMTSVTAR